MPAGAGMYVKFATAKRYIESKYPVIVQNSEPVADNADKLVEEKPKPKNRQAVRKLVEELREARFSTSSSDDY